eukprot:TRINITY_DN11909_c1_g2_i1.p1 TRINITY_DN11909_c1_g2~~TRINITY_DN11909_c1_g2_i1.p1  ORF type:complete len:644 (+),score=60.38 TRINITY_DN11909_c1_g2_i1:60-1991(+)
MPRAHHEMQCRNLIFLAFLLVEACGQLLAGGGGRQGGGGGGSALAGLAPPPTGTASPTRPTPPSPLPSLPPRPPTPSSLPSPTPSPPPSPALLSPPLPPPSPGPLPPPSPPLSPLTPAPSPPLTPAPSPPLLPAPLPRPSPPPSPPLSLASSPSFSPPLSPALSLPPGGPSQMSQTKQADACRCSTRPEIGSRFPVYLDLSWKIFSSWNDGKGSITGTMLANAKYFCGQVICLLEDETVHLTDFLNVENFMGGQPGRLSAGKMGGPTDSISEGLLIVGEFTQDLDGRCMPFDRQIVTFNLTMHEPFGFFVRLRLCCNRNDCTLYDSRDEKFRSTGPPPVHAVGDGRNSTGSYSKITKLVDTRHQGKTAVGFQWSEMTCRLEPAEGEGSDKILCKMIGTRDAGRMLLQEIAPGIVMSFVVLSSFCIPVGMSMPRIAITMISLMTFVAKATSALSSLPSTGSSFIAEFYSIGLLFMFVSLLGHTFSFVHTSWHALVDSVFLYAGCITFFLALAIRTRKKTCPLIDNDSLDGMIATLSVLLITSLMLIIVKHRLQLKERLQTVCSPCSTRKLTQRTEPHEPQSKVAARDDVEVGDESADVSPADTSTSLQCANGKSAHTSRSGSSSSVMSAWPVTDYGQILPQRVQ